MFDLELSQRERWLSMSRERTAGRSIASAALQASPTARTQDGSMILIRCRAAICSVSDVRSERSKV